MHWGTISFGGDETGGRSRRAALDYRELRGPMPPDVSAPALLFLRQRLILGAVDALGCRWTDPHTRESPGARDRRGMAKESSTRPEAGVHVTAMPVPRPKFARRRSAARALFVRHILVRTECDAQPRKVPENRLFAKMRQRCSRIAPSISGRKALRTRA